MKPAISTLTTTDLSIGYQKGAPLLSHLNLALREAEMICLMGPNGSGKSSLLRTLAGLQKPLDGAVGFAGSSAGTGRERHISLVLTDRVQAVNMTVEEIVAFGRYPYLGWNIRLTPDDRRIIGTAIEQVRIQALLKKKLYELSDGQLQMVMIARALAQDTPVMLLDEPTAHLDLNNRVEIMNLLRLLSRTTRKSILLATHELDLALQTADRIWLTGKDRAVTEGLSEDLVLTGVFDEIFRFKGFDLRSGKVRHQPFRGVRLQLIGEGSSAFWTKNALERNGFEVGQETEAVSVTVTGDSVPKWIVNRGELTTEADSVEKLLDLL